jgi:uncharacterized protein (TIGR03083 family)
VEFDAYLDEVRNQAAAMRAAAVAAGPDAVVPTCPGWTMTRLVRHISKVYNWVTRSLDTSPDGERPSPDQSPEGWDEALAWWDEQLATMLTGLRERGADGPAWTFGDMGTAGFWARRQAHETAIHRLDAEHALVGSAAPSAVPSLVFTPELAADGIDEAVTFLYPRSAKPGELSGTVLFHAADAGRAWLVTLRPGAALEVGPATEIDTDASVVGTADAVYRAAWQRPSTAVVGGDRDLVAALRTP